MTPTDKAAEEIQYVLMGSTFVEEFPDSAKEQREMIARIIDRHARSAEVVSLKQLRIYVENIIVTARVITAIRWGYDGDGGADAAAESIIELAEASKAILATLSNED